MMELELSDLLLCKFSEDGQGPDFYNCWNFCREVYKRAGRMLPFYHEWICSIAARHSLIIKIKESDDFIRLENPELFCLVGIMYVPKHITHIGVVIGRGRIIHINKTHGVIIERLDSLFMTKRIEGYYRYVGDSKACKSVS